MIIVNALQLVAALAEFLGVPGDLAARHDREALKIVPPARCFLDDAKIFARPA